MLQVVGTYLVYHFLHSDSADGVFGTVLGLMAWIYLAAQIMVYAAEINVVLTRRLWPRAMVQPPLTKADRASLTLQALQNQRRPEQHVRCPSTSARPATRPRHSTPQTPPGGRAARRGAGAGAAGSAPAARASSPAARRPEDLGRRAPRPGTAARPIHPLTLIKRDFPGSYAGEFPERHSREFGRTICLRIFPRDAVHGGAG